MRRRQQSALANPSCRESRLIRTEQLQQIGALLSQLLHRALIGRFIWTSAEEFCAVAKTLFGHTAKPDFRRPALS
jgi:hypothetical protein